MSGAVDADDVGLERAKLLDELAELLRRFGWQRFAVGPIVYPDGAHFPEPQPRVTVATVRAVTRRVFAHLGAGKHFRVFVDDYRDTVPGGKGSENRLADIALDTADVSSARFQLLTNGIADWLVYATAHQAVRAVRACPAIARGTTPPAEGFYRSAPIIDDDGEELTAIDADDRRTTLAAFALGLGVIVARGTALFRALEDLRGSMIVTQHARAAIGGLTDDEAGFLVAAQLVARGSDETERERITAVFEPTRAEAIEKLVLELEHARAAIVARLGMPVVDEWPPPTSLEFPLDALPEDAAAAALERQPESVRANAGKIVNRTRRWTRKDLVRQGSRIGIGIALLFFLTAFVANELWFVLLGLAFGALAVPFWIATDYLFSSDVCSDADCHADLSSKTKECPRCGGTVAPKLGA